MRSLLSRIKMEMLSREQMKQVTGGDTIVCEDIIEISVWTPVDWPGIPGGGQMDTEIICLPAG